MASPVGTDVMGVREKREIMEIQVIYLQTVNSIKGIVQPKKLSIITRNYTI